MIETVTVNGTDLNQMFAQNITDISGLVTIPAKRGTDIEIPGRHGQLRVPRKRYSSTTVVIPVWVRGVNPDGTAPGGDDATRVVFFNRVRALVNLFTVGETVTVRHVLTDGTTRQITGEVTDVLNSSTLTTSSATGFAEVLGVGKSSFARFSVSLDCADPFWSDESATVGTITGTTGVTGTLSGFAAASAPMDNLSISFGPSSNPSITQTVTGVTLAYNGIIASGRHLVVDTSAWTATGTIDAGGTWNPGSAPTQHIARVAHSGDFRLFSLTPEVGGPELVLSHTGGGSATVTVTGNLRYLVG